MSDPAPIAKVALSRHTEGWQATQGELALTPRPTAREAWDDAIKGHPRVAATILDTTFRPDVPEVVWKRACHKLGKGVLEPTPEKPTLRLVTPEDVANRIAERDAKDPRPKIYIEPGQLPRLVYDTLDALAANTELYRRAGEIVEPVTSKRRWQTADSSPALVMSPVTSALMQLRAGVTCRFVRANDEGERDVDLKPAQATIITAEGARSQHLPVLSGVLECPALRPDGSIIRAKGYDDATGFYLAHEFELKGLKDKPTREDAKAAYKRLSTWLFSADRDGKKGFAWKNGQKDAIVPIAMLLSALARPAIQPPKGCIPLFVFSASGKGSGKGTAVDLVFVVVTGRTAPVMSWSSDEDENDKRIGGIAYDAPALACIDNIPEDVPFGHARLDAAMTADETAFRVLGKTGNIVLPWGTILALTGNNFVGIGDIGRRGVICYQCPDSEDPASIPQEERVIPNIVEYAMLHRETIIVDALTILRAYCVAERPDMKIEMGTFTKWAKLVGNALAWVGAGNITDWLIGNDATSEPPQKAAVRDLARCLHKATENGNGVTIQWLADDLYSAEYCEKKRKNGDIVPDIHRDPFRSAIETLCPFKGPPSNDPGFRLRLAKVLAKHRGQWHAGFQIDQELNPATGKVYDQARWLARKKP